MLILGLPKATGIQLIVNSRLGEREKSEAWVNQVISCKSKIRVKKYFPLKFLYKKKNTYVFFFKYGLQSENASLVKIHVLVFV